MKRRRWDDATPRIPQAKCPHCDHVLNAASVPGRRRPPEPVEGDLSVCLGCGEVLMFDARQRLNKTTAAILAGLDPNEIAELRIVQRAVRSVLDDDL